MKLSLKLQSPTIEIPITAVDSANNKDNIIIAFYRYDLKESRNKLQEFQDILSHMENNDLTESEEFTTFVTEGISYIRNIKLDNGAEEFKIKDTRVVKPLESFWKTSEECINFLLEMYLNSTPWKMSIIEGLQKALVNTNFENDQAKN